MKNCPTQNNLHDFLSGEVMANERETLELHLADCADCRSNLVLMFNETTENFVAPDSLKEKVKNLPAKESKANSASFFSFNWFKINRLQVGFAAMLFVCFGLFGLYVWQSQTPSNSGDVLRNGSGNKTDLKLLAPEDNVVIKGSSVEFEWEKVSDASSYILIISDEKGDIVFQEQTKQTKLTFSKKLNEQNKYFWYVQAKLIDGRVTETTPRKFIFER